MVGMNIQERYDDISAISGLSEDIIRRVFKATRESMAKSLKKGERATLPGICTIVPDLRQRLDIGGENVVSYIKLKASSSSALETELQKLNSFENEEDVQKKEDIEQERLTKLNFSAEKIPRYYSSDIGIRTTQISGLL